MEDFITKKAYLLHLKRISQIKNKPFKKPLDGYTSRLNYSEKINHLLGSSEQDEKKISFQRRENLLKTFLKDKENNRLVQRINSIQGFINMKKYEKEYHELKKCIQNHRKVKSPTKNQTNLRFKIFDISFTGKILDSDEIYSVYEIKNGKKKIIVTGNIHTLRNEQISLKKDQSSLLKIIGKNQGYAYLSNSSMIPILKRKQCVGTLIIEFI